MTKAALKKNDRRERFLRYAPIILWIGVIMFLSSGQASMSNTSIFVRPVLKFLFPDAPEEILAVYHGYVRKLAHVTVYAILAFWSARAFVSSSQKWLRRFWIRAAFLTVFLVAVIDETNQSFINSRTGSVYDVLLDVTGGAIMISAFYVITEYKNRQRL